MKHETSKVSEIVVSDSVEGFDLWINRGYIPDELRDELKKADILIVPVEGHVREDVIAFPEITEDIFLYLKRNLPFDYKVDVCISDKDYKELALHSDLTILGSFLVTAVVAPFFINLLTSYVYEKITNGGNDKSVKVAVTVVGKKGQSKKIEYEGKAENFSLIAEELNKLGDDFK